MRGKLEVTGDWSNMEAFLKKAMRPESAQSELRRMGEEGVRALSAATPKGETGETSAGWRYRIEPNSKGYQLYWYNVAHPHTTTPVAILIQYGHGTGTGGYVPPIDYINPALNPIFQSALERLSKGMR